MSRPLPVYKAAIALQSADIMSQPKDITRSVPPGLQHTAASRGTDTTDSYDYQPNQYKQGYQKLPDSYKRDYPTSTQGEVYQRYQNSVRGGHHPHTYQYSPPPAAGALSRETHQAYVSQHPYSQSQVLRAGAQEFHTAQQANGKMGTHNVIRRSQSQEFQTGGAQLYTQANGTGQRQYRPHPNQQQAHPSLHVTQYPLPTAIEIPPGSDTHGQTKPTHRVIRAAITDESETVHSKDKTKSNQDTSTPVPHTEPEPPAPGLVSKQEEPGACQQPQQGTEQRPNSNAEGRENEQEEDQGRPQINTAFLTLAVNETNMIGEHSSYHQGIPGEEAIRRLRESGQPHCYLTRYSEALGNYVLSVYQKRRPKDVEKHFKIVIENRKHKINGLDKEFDDIGQLLDYYEEHRIHPSLKNIGHNYTEDAYNASEQAHVEGQDEGNEPPQAPNARPPQENVQLPAEENRPPQAQNEDPPPEQNRPGRRCSIL